MQVRENWTDQHIASEYPSLKADCLRQIKKCIEIGLQCVETDRQRRPSIEEIIDQLNGRHPNLATRSYWYESDYPHAILMAVSLYQIQELIHFSLMCGQKMNGLRYLQPLSAESHILSWVPLIFCQSCIVAQVFLYCFS